GAKECAAIDQGSVPPSIATRRDASTPGALCVGAAQVARPAPETTSKPRTCAARCGCAPSPIERRCAALPARAAPVGQRDLPGALAEPQRRLEEREQRPGAVRVVRHDALRADTVGTRTQPRAAQAARAAVLHVSSEVDARARAERRARRTSARARRA